MVVLSWVGWVVDSDVEQGQVEGRRQTAIGRQVADASFTVVMMSCHWCHRIVSAASPRAPGRFNHNLLHHNSHHNNKGSKLRLVGWWTVMWSKDR